MPAGPVFTVFTPTFNRAQLLARVYDDLREQTFKDFEWLIVDDGSTDGTGQLVASWTSSAPFPVRYLVQENSGKHVALNRGVREAHGEYILIVDSDDRSLPRTLEVFLRAWQAIPEEERDLYSTVVALCGRPDGTLIGRPFPAAVVDGRNIAEQLQYLDSGERCGALRTAVLKQFPLPEVPGERFIAEGIVWNRIAVRYRARFVNEVLQIKDFQPGGLTDTALRLRIQNPQGAMLFYAEAAAVGPGFRRVMRAVVNYVRFGLHGGQTAATLVRSSPKRVLALVALLPAYAVVWRDRRQMRMRQ